MNLKEFKGELRLIFNTFEDALEAWFECCAHLYVAGENIPDEWKYVQKVYDDRNPDSFWYHLFDEATPEQLLLIGHFLFRYLKLLNRHGKIY